MDENKVVNAKTLDQDVEQSDEDSGGDSGDRKFLKIPENFSFVVL